MDRRRAADQSRLRDEADGVPVVDGTNPATGERKVLDPPVEVTDDVGKFGCGENATGRPRRVIDRFGAGGSASEIEAEVVGLGPQAVEDGLAELVADPTVASVWASRVHQAVKGGRHATADGGVVAVGTVAVAKLFNGEPAVGERERTGKWRWRRHTGHDQVGLDACDRGETLAGHERRPVHLGNDCSAIGQLETGDDPHPGFVEPCRYHGDGQGVSNGSRQSLGHEDRITCPQDRLHHSRHPPRVRVRDQIRQLVH